VVNFQLFPGFDRFLDARYIPRHYIVSGKKVSLLIELLVGN